MEKTALLYRKKDGLDLECLLCGHFCTIKEGAKGICAVRHNKGGKLYSLNYGKLVANNCDPIEKKPLFHFFPGSLSYSIASVGCNFQCAFCQNWQISQSGQAVSLGIESSECRPFDVVQAAKVNRCQSISYTYTEPTLSLEFALDCAKIAKENKLYNIFVTNGYMSKGALKLIGHYLDAANIDLKAFSDSFYEKLCKAHLKPVLDTIERMKKLNIWIELTTLLIPGMNDNEKEISAIADFIAFLDKDMPWHISRFFPHYKFRKAAPTSFNTLSMAYDIAKSKGLNFVYMGNYKTQFGENTVCPNCFRIVVERECFSLRQFCLKKGKCQFCNYHIAGVFV
ncbi:MAG: AmmeMemoRadiSam system radical SAM enzyme [Candidatus Omnitrophota bacterium]